MGLPEKEPLRVGDICFTMLLGEVTAGVYVSRTEEAMQADIAKIIASERPPDSSAYGVIVESAPMERVIAKRFKLEGGEVTGHDFFGLIIDPITGVGPSSAHRFVKLPEHLETQVRAIIALQGVGGYFGL